MADFIRFKANGQFLLVNIERVTAVAHHLNVYDYSAKPPTLIVDEATTKICFAGTDTDYIIVDEPFEQVCDKLNGNVQTGTWIEKKVEDDEHDPYRLFKRRFYCSECGEWQTYGMTAYCPFCGKPMWNGAMWNGDEAE